MDIIDLPRGAQRGLTFGPFKDKRLEAIMDSIFKGIFDTLQPSSKPPKIKEAPRSTPVPSIAHFTGCYHIDEAKLRSFVKREAARAQTLRDRATSKGHNQDRTLRSLTREGPLSSDSESDSEDNGSYEIDTRLSSRPESPHVDSVVV